jgi:putative membrane-bound dehydrogenase-like protein
MRFCSLVFCLVCTSAPADFPELFNTDPDAATTPRMSAEEAAAKFELPAGFSASVFAAEPDVQNPIAMSWDSRGRLWIAENYTYAERGQRFQLDLRDRVVIFDNTTGDTFKKRTVFTDNVQMLTGLEVAPDGVWLMCPPQLIFIPDRDHDDVPDSPGQVVLDGFTVAQQNYHNFANGLRIGPDGWLYGRCGGSCPGRIGIPGTPDEQRVAMEGGIWRYHPVTKTVESLTSGTTNPWGHDWNGVGEMFFVNTVNGHLWHLIPGAHFTRPFTLDPNRRTYELIDFHADHWHFDTGQSWTKSRDGEANSYGGGHAHSGTMIYQGLNWPQQYRGNLFTLNFHGRRANQEILERKGGGYVAKHGKDFMIAADPWFRGMELSAGPDGGVFVLDWSDTGECHEHTGVHRTSGRIYKITYDSTSKTQAATPPGDVSDWSLDALVRAPSQRNQWTLRQARQTLLHKSRIGEDVSAAGYMLAMAMVDDGADSRHRVQTLLTMYGIGSLNANFMAGALDHYDEHVRAWTIRIISDHWRIDDTLGPTWRSEQAAARVAQESGRWLPEFQRMSREDDSSLVRLTLASTLQRLPVSSRASLAEALVSHGEDADDHNLPLMVWYGLIPVAKKNAASLVPVAKACRLPTTLRLISRCLAEEIENQPQAIDQLLREVAARKDASFRETVLAGISEGLQGWKKAPQPASWSLITSMNSPSTGSLVTELSAVFGDGRALADLERIARGDGDVAPETRLAALSTLIQSDADNLRSVCETLLTDQRMNALAARGLSKFDDPEIGKVLVSRYRNFRGPDRPQVISILCSRKSFAEELLGAMKKGSISRSDLSAYQVRQIHSLADSALSRTVSEVWGEVRDSPAEKKKAIEQTKRSLTPEVLGSADKSNGRRLFVKHCQNCHRLYGDGEKVGPDLTGSDRSNLDYLIGNVIDPSAVVDKDYRMTILLLDDNRVINGLVTEESDRTIRVQTATELLTLDKQSVEVRRVTEKSPMPDGLFDALSREEIRDLVGYVQHPSQVALP